MSGKIPTNTSTNMDRQEGLVIDDNGDIAAAYANKIDGENAYE